MPRRKSRWTLVPRRYAGLRSAAQSQAVTCDFGHAPGRPPGETTPPLTSGWAVATRGEHPGLQTIDDADLAGDGGEGVLYPAPGVRPGSGGMVVGVPFLA